MTATPDRHDSDAEAVTTRGVGVVVACGIAAFLVYVDFFSVQVALPQMANDLGATVADLQWVISAYMLSLASFLIVGGRLADILGRKTWLAIGVLVFATASLFGGLGTSAEFVIFMRVLQGLGAAVIMPVSMAIVTNAFPANRVQRAVGYVLGIAAVGQALGPVIGGLFTEYLSWRWVLWINVPLSAVALIAMAVSVKQSYDKTAGRRVDWTGLVLVVTAVGVFTMGIDQAANWGWGDWRTLGLIVAGLVGIGVFIKWEGSYRQPLLDLTLFRNREFSVMTLAGAAGNMALVASIFLSVLLFQTQYDYSVIHSAYLLLALSLGLTIAAQIAGRLERFGSWNVMTAALLLGGIGVIVMGSTTNNVPAFLLASVVGGFGTGIAWNFASVVTQSIVDPSKAGSASGAVLTVLIGLGGVATATAASLAAGAASAENGGSGSIGAVLIGFGAFALLATIPVALSARGRSTQRV